MPADTDPNHPDAPAFAPGAYRIYSAWAHAGDTSGRATYAAIIRAWRVGCRDEAKARTEGLAHGAIEVIDLIDGFGRWKELTDRDPTFFAGVAAEVFYAGQPWRRRLLLAWQILRPRPRRAARKGSVAA